MDVLTRNNVKVAGRGAQPMPFAHGVGRDRNAIAPMRERFARRDAA